MKFSLDWLRSYVQLDEGPEQVAAWLAAAGLPVDASEAWGADHILDVDVLANRPDCMCHLGLARELAARCARPLRIPVAEPVGDGEPADRLASVEITAPDLCSRYTALVLTGVTVRPSPDWLQDRLMAIGLRPINNLVDATNFVLHEMGQPLHAFDLDRLAGGAIVVRRAEPGERLETLDGETRELLADDLVIADRERALALAGIMGGANSEIGDGTSRVLIESAHFTAAAVRSTSRRLGMHTDASHRFERGTDPGITLTAARRAADLMLETCGGTLAAGAVDAISRPVSPSRLKLCRRRLDSLLGLQVQLPEAAAALASLGFQAEDSGPDGEALSVSVPTWRVDVTEEVDLIEEVGRMIGYDRVPATVPAFPSTTAGAQRPTAAQDRCRSYLAAVGFAETIHFPMTSRAEQERFTFPADSPARLVELDNPMNRQMDLLRGSLLPGLLESLVHNRNHGNEDVLLFEVGRVFREREDLPTGTAELPLPEERTLVAAVACGRPDHPFWSGRREPLAFYDMKGILDGLLLRATGEAWAYRAPAAAGETPFLAPSAAAVVSAAAGVRGWIGTLGRDAAPDLGEDRPVLAFEVDITAAPLSPPGARYEPLPRHPSADRDLAILLPEQVGYHEVEDLLRREGGELLESVTLFDRYQGDPVPAGKVSLAVRLVFRAADRTLTAPEVQEVVGKMIAALGSRLGGDIRDA